jgi:hypothetical protein
MLADDAEYRCPRREEEEEEEGAEAPSVHAVVIDGSFGPIRRLSVDSTIEKESVQETASVASTRTTTGRVSSWLRDTIIVPLFHYADSRFPDARMERQFTREVRLTKKGADASAGSPRRAAQCWQPASLLSSTSSLRCCKKSTRPTTTMRTSASSASSPSRSHSW